MPQSNKKSSTKSKKQNAFTKFLRNKLALLIASPLAIILTVVIVAGSTSAAVITYRAISQAEANVELDDKTEEKEVAKTPAPTPEPKNDSSDKDPDSTPPPIKEDGSDEYLVWRNCVDNVNVVTGKTCQMTNYTGEDEKRDEERRNSYEAIRAYLDARGWPEAQISGTAGNWYITATKTMPTKTFDCPGEPLRGNYDKLARYYDYTFGTLMPPSVKGRHVVINFPTPDGTIVMTIREDKTHNISNMDYSGIVFDAGQERDFYQFVECK